MDTSQIEKAIELGKIPELLLGEDGFALVYPHFYDLVKTDINFVIVGINECMNKMEDGKAADLSEMITNVLCQLTSFPLGTYHSIRYLNSYLQMMDKTKKLGLKLNLQNLVNEIQIALSSQVDELKKQKLDSFYQYDLIKKEIEGVKFGTIVNVGINENLLRLGYLQLKN